MASRIDQNTSNSHFDLQFRESESESESKSEGERARRCGCCALLSLSVWFVWRRWWWLTVSRRPSVPAVAVASFHWREALGLAAVVARIVGTLLGASALLFRLWLNRGWGSQFVELKVP